MKKLGTAMVKTGRVFCCPQQRRQDPHFSRLTRAFLLHFTAYRNIPNIYDSFPQALSLKKDDHRRPLLCRRKTAVIRSPADKPCIRQPEKKTHFGHKG
jgi:hypothetical protein